MSLIHIFILNATYFQLMNHHGKLRRIKYGIWEILHKAKYTPLDLNMLH